MAKTRLATAGGGVNPHQGCLIPARNSPTLHISKFLWTGIPSSGALTGIEMTATKEL
jgi:hypothetical protein